MPLYPPLRLIQSFQAAQGGTLDFLHDTSTTYLTSSQVSAMLRLHTSPHPLHLDLHVPANPLLSDFRRNRIPWASSRSTQIAQRSSLVQT